MEGWITLDRKILDWEWFDDSNMVHLFLYLLLKANHEDSRWHGKVIKRGQLVTGRSRICESTGMTERVVRRCLDNLEKSGVIIKEASNKFSIITIYNYDRYQNNTKNRVQQTSNKRPTKDQQTSTNNNDNNIIGTSTNVDIPSEPQKEVKPKKQSKKKNDVITDENGNLALFSSEEGRKPAQKAKDYVQPTIEEVISYFEAQGKSRESAELFFYHYDGLGWRNIRGTRIVHWDSIANKWMREEEEKSISNQKKNERSTNFRSDYDLAEEERNRRHADASDLVRGLLNGDIKEATSDVW